MPSDPPGRSVESELRPGGVLALRICPGGSRGLLDESVLHELADACLSAAGPSVRVVVLEGARDDVFATGGPAGAEAAPLAAARRLAKAAWESIDATTVAVVRGACLGSAIELLLASDLVIAFPSATFAWADLGPGAGGRRLSEAALAELFGRGDAIASERALANGLVDLVVRSEDELSARIRSLAGEAGEAFRRIKQAARELPD